MIEVIRRRTVSASPQVVKAVLLDLEHLGRLLPRAEKVEVHGGTENRARVVITVRAGALGARRIDGEARVLPDGLRFVAVRPVQVDVQWTIQQRGDHSEVSIRFTADPAGPLGQLSRFVPRGIVEHRIAQELDRTLDALETLVERKES